MKKILTVIVVLAVIVGLAFFLRGGGGPKELGKGVPEGARITGIDQVLQAGKDWHGREITVQGEITEKCPTSGCWFYIKDSTDRIRVDTAPSGFTVTEVPIGKTATVHGKVVTSEGGTEIVATGVEY